MLPKTSRTRWNSVDSAPLSAATTRTIPAVMTVRTTAYSAAVCPRSLEGLIPVPMPQRRDPCAPPAVAAHVHPFALPDWAWFLVALATVAWTHLSRGPRAQPSGGEIAISTRQGF